MLVLVQPLAVATFPLLCLGSNSFALLYRGNMSGSLDRPGFPRGNRDPFLDWMAPGIRKRCERARKFHR